MKKKKISKILLVILFIAVLAAFAGSYAMNLANNSKASIYEINSENAGGEIEINMEVSKNWKDNGKFAVGAQYDAKINVKGRKISGWKLIIHLPENAEIDSAWNGNFVQDENNDIIVTPVDYNEQISSSKVETIGFVLLSDKVLNIHDFTFEAYCHKPIFKEPLFYLGLLLLNIWLILLITSIVVGRKATQMNTQRDYADQVIMQTMNTLISFIDAKDPNTKGHSSRVAYYTKELAKRMGMKDDEVKNMYYIALLHDCGKIGIPDEILNKAGKLTPDERLIIQSHTVIGAKALSKMTSIPGIQDGAKYHHEKYDGTGYPSGLKGKDIPLVGRIICVADSFDVMSSNRVYRNHLQKDEIIHELSDCAGSQFDPDIVPYMIQMINEGVAPIWSNNEI